MQFTLRALRFALCIYLFLLLAACAPQVMKMEPREGPPGTEVEVEIEYLVGWPRVEMGGVMMDFHQVRLLSADPKRAEVPGEELVWIEDKILKFRAPDLPPGEYTVTVHDHKGPPGDTGYAILETTAYILFPPVWPFVFRSNQTTVKFKVISNQ